MSFCIVSSLIAALTKAGNCWPLENRHSSYVWQMPSLQAWVKQHCAYEAVLHQCSYGLMLKDDDGKYGRCKKQTRFLGNRPHLDQMSRLCSCRTNHVHAVGGIKTKQGWKRRSEMAGQYPMRLCHKYGELVSLAI
jgi:hypothetical protein